uniref:Ig-like domain-containing protein n=1 Tax=Neogobius melanostomus TaxID=47308 RepID=A0A8C6SY93_9GOBI
MFNMASVGIIVTCLLSSLILEAKSQNFVTVECQKSEIVAQYGTSTLLDCVVQNNKGDPTEIELVTWKLNKTKVLSFDNNETEQKPGFQFAIRSPWNPSNMNVSLLITDTNLSHAGDYSCSVLTVSGTGKSNVHLTVKSNYSKPVIDTDPEKITPDKGFTLTCKAHGGFPEGYIRWVVNDAEWKNQPVVEAIKTSNGLYDLTSKLAFGPDSQFTKFVCEVYSANGVKQGTKTFEIPPMDQRTGSNTEGKSNAKIWAPVFVIGSLIVGLLVAVLVMCRRRQQSE